ncbi:uncharacterized protein DUF2631 [Stackebrandtia albiflava]|uniref:Uncharacterized protein DUF2631 n=1 Tax=Stackebrandtia albiflava TaxID=406432 RepID=A0A562VAH3_9ACTN|nr:DUF2631 domain-containing protein [Stackebrandtia albiflava]TWJ14865.1 uncharacterized protein DUF2631 [Stackebrandtia albiflava]
MAGHDEPVTSPDQRKPTNRKLAYTVGIAAIITMVAYLYGNHEGRVEDLWLGGFAIVIALAIITDWVMVRNGLRE